MRSTSLRIALSLRYAITMSSFKLSKKVSARHSKFHYLPGGDLYGSDEVSIDGVHPNDEAFASMAAKLAPVIADLLRK